MAAPARVMLFAAAEVPGGLLSHVALLARELAASGHDVTVTLPPASGADAAARSCAGAGAAVIRARVRGKTNLSGMLTLRRHVARVAPDIFHAHLSSPGEGLPALAAARWGGASRLVTTEHAPAHFPLERFYSRPVKRLAASALSAVVAVCEADARLLRDGFGIPAHLVRVIPNGVDPPATALSRDAARAAMGIEPGRPVIGCAGALEVKKGVLDLVETVRRLGRADAVLALAGEGSQAAALRRMAGELPFRLLLPGHVSDLYGFLAALDVFALASHQEAMPLSLLQAMMAGMPIVATRVGGVPEVLETAEAGLLVEPSRPEEMTRAIAGLLAAPDRARLLGDRARRTALSRYTVTRMAGEVGSLYAQVLSDGGRAAAGARA
ncbi:MAG: glycosyltransferase family 4 protein [Candidatus Polarisedimenticolia bacterium]